MRNFANRFQALFHPELYHGWGRSRKFFEGWYYKIVNPDETKAFAFIPGIAMAEDGQKQVFIQVLDGINKSAEYHKFTTDEFKPSGRRFKLRIANNAFSIDQVQLNLPSVKGNLKFIDQVPWPTSFVSPGIMGPYTFVPFMECYHGILSMDHTIEGVLMINNEKIDFTGGRGYMEKDWGKSFPGAYIWLQSNHFKYQGISIKISVARIPWLGSSFTGFIAGLWIHDRLIQFTTYNSSKLVNCKIDQDNVELLLENKNYRLDILARRCEATELASPIMGMMDGKIEESMCSEIEVKLTERKTNKVILQDIGRNAALEVAGEVEKIMTD